MPDDELGATLPETPESSAHSFDLARALAIPAGERYTQIRVLGQGGMGEVLLVADRVIGRDVALRRTRPDRDRGREQSAREAMLARSIPLVVSLGCVAMGGLFGVRLRTTLLELQQRSVLQAWQLRQLVPKAAGAVTTPQTGPREVMC